MRIINLLPKEAQDQLRLDRINHLVARFWSLAILSLLLFLGLGFGVQQYLRLSVGQVEKRIAENNARLQSADIREVQEQVLGLNSSLAEINSVRSQQYRWSEVMIELARILPKSAQVSTVRMDRETGEVVILGRAENRDMVIETWSKLKQSELFRDVNFPLPNLERPTDSNFTYTFFVNLEKIKHDEFQK